MKYIPLILVAFFLTSTAQAWPFGKKETKPQTPAVVVAKPKPTIGDGREIVKEISAELKAAKEENLKLKASLEKAIQSTKQAEAQTQVVQKQANDLKEWGVIQQEQAQKFMEKYNKAVKRYHRLKMIAAAIAAIVGVFIGMQFMYLAPPPYSFGVPVAGAGLFAALVWLFL